MATLTANDSPRLSPSERATLLALLEEYANALAVYHDNLKKPPETESRVLTDCILSDSDDLEVPSLQLSLEESARLTDTKEQATCAKLYEDRFPPKSAHDSEPDAVLQRRSLYVRKLVENLKEEIRERGTFEVLTKEVEKTIARKKEKDALRFESERLEKLVAKLQETITNEKIIHEEERKRIVNELSTEQSNVERLKLMANVELEYVTAWEEARCEQNALRCDMEAEKLEKILNHCRVQETNMKRIHKARTKFLTQEIEKLEEQTKEWEERYVREKEIYEREIRQLRIEIATRQKELEGLKEEYRRNQEFIDTYLAEKEALRREKEEKERAQRSAIRIQAWWRGIMVRRKLGPYRPQEKKKKRPAKGKK